MCLEYIERKEKNMLKKVLVMLIAGMMLLSLCACSDKGTQTSSDSVTLKWLVPGDEQPDTAKVVAEANKIIEPAIGAKLDLQFVSVSAYSEKMKMNMASGAKFDLCFTSNWLNTYDQAVNGGGLYDITDLIDDELKAEMDEKVWNDAKIDERIYAVPNQQVMFQQLAVAARTDLLEKYNFDINSVENINDIEPFLETIKQNEPNVYPYRAKWGVSPWVYETVSEKGGATGVGYHNAMKKLMPFYETEEVKEAVAKLREWYQKGYIRADYASAGDDTTDTNQGKYAVKIETWKPGIESSSDATGIEYTYKTITKPYFTGARAAMTGVGANSENPEKAVALIKLVNTNKDLYNLICYGIEGEHYTLNAEGKIILNFESGYLAQGDWKYGNQFNAKLSEGMEDNVWKETERLNAEAVVDELSDWQFDKTPVKNELAQVSSVFDEYSDFITVKDYDAFVANRKQALEEAGYQKVFNEIEKQINEYLAQR